MIDKLISRLIITIVLISINLIAYAEVMNLKGKYYEKDSCIYLIEYPTEEEKLAEQEYYKQRMIKREAQVNVEIERNHEIKLAEIKAQAMRDYLIAQSLPLKEVAEVIRNIKPTRTWVNIGDISSNSSSSATGGQVTNTTNNDNVNINTNTNENTNDNETNVDTSVDVTVK